VLAPAAAGPVLNHPTDEDLSVGTLVHHPTDEDLSVGTLVHHPTDEDLSVGTLVELGDAVHWSFFAFSFFGKFLLLPLFFFFVRLPYVAWLPSPP
jgi:hypothetical protein